MTSTSEHPTNADFTTFLDDFVFNVFLPQIGDKIFELFRKATTGKLVCSLNELNMIKQVINLIL